MADTKKVRMKETYTVKRGAYKGRNLFFNEVYELPAEVVKEIKDADAGGDTQKDATATAAPVVPVGPAAGSTSAASGSTSGTKEDAEKTAQRR